jgi:hypothetical protein
VKVAKGTKLDGINKFLQAQSNWASYGVPGYLPAKAFFACLAQREFPTTVLIRPREVMDYLPEPDIFHDVFGHVPLHTLRSLPTSCRPTARRRSCATTRTTSSGSGGSSGSPSSSG